jgi:hypothetical protein
MVLSLTVAGVANGQPVGPFVSFWYAAGGSHRIFTTGMAGFA